MNAKTVIMAFAVLLTTSVAFSQTAISTSGTQMEPGAFAPSSNLSAEQSEKIKQELRTIESLPPEQRERALQEFRDKVKREQGITLSPDFKSDMVSPTRTGPDSVSSTQSSMDTHPRTSSGLTSVSPVQPTTGSGSSLQSGTSVSPSQSSAGASSTTSP